MYIHAKLDDKQFAYYTPISYLLVKRLNPAIQLISSYKSQNFRFVDHKAIYESLRKLETRKLNRYQADEYGHTVFQAFVLRLTHNRGFLAGYYLEDSDCYTVDYSTAYKGEYGAINEANRQALRACEDEEQYIIEQRALEIIEELKQDLKTERTDTLQALKGAPRKAREKLLHHWLERKRDRYAGIRELTEKPYMATEWRA